ncbi:MAG TPA: LysR family transcriptional regulator [Sediminibacterium sp.]|uniref:LysR family transcriptional regulator n=1 Tax=Sediminibacterium sp. TaxID=1917865 RepID=UPI0008C04385|nr:LysR family transcriptional regulator [Sediminibacterium sp.]OHC85741.1 MAG: LysR family transcriptional regulator [Sphingobacteriia bacterium RIFOXYC2_FULL_35_18]OHC87277.1 MAG: LysR family transcriptional regulator [Sphingobacteriia bacterium RIFOXYD2_FULL_35_12]HLD52613.1 LysR family transcriptional regulator [Sediminibacterium sp.]
MNYTINQLQIFLKVVETQSVTKASEELHLSQPAVSIQLKNFQDQFDIPLTEVVGRKIYITEFGKEIANTVENIMLQVHAMNNKTFAFKGQLSGKLKIAVVSTGKYVMPYFLNGFMKMHTGIQLNMDVTNKSMVIESLEKNEIDFALVSILPAAINIEKIDFLPNKLFLIGNTPTKSSIQDLPLIFREKGSGTRQAMEQFIQKNKLTIQKKMELSTNEAVKQALIAGLGYSVMPIIGIKNEIINKQLFIIPVKGLPIKTTWSLIWLKGKKHSPVAEAYLKYINLEKKQVAKTFFSWSDQY